jgi:hypothetical protein
MKRFLPVSLSLALTAASAFASVDTGLIALIPSKTTIVAGIDVDKCRSSDFGQFLLSRSQASDPHFQQFMTQTGFDPRRDLDSVVMTTSSQPGVSKGGFAILARGNFDQGKIQALAQSHGATLATYQGVTLSVNLDKHNGQTIAVAFPDTGVAVMGDLDSVHQVIQNLSTPSTLNVDLSNQIDTVGNANDAWFVSETGATGLAKQIASDSAGPMANQAQALQKISAASGGVVFGPVVAVSLDATTRSSQDATSLADVVRFMASMVQMKRQEDPRAAILASSFDNMQLKANEDVLHISFSIPEKNLEQMAQVAPPAKH